MALRKATFKVIAEAFRMPSAYLYLRANANASGAHVKHCQRDEAGRVVGIGKHLISAAIVFDWWGKSNDNTCPAFPAK